MKEYTAKDIRNIGIFGHGGVGKTTLTEAMLFDAGLSDRLGKVDNGTAVTDYDPEEVKRHISINMALAPFEWKGTKINVIDAPGFFDFYGEVASAMELADSALVLVSAVSGLEVGAEKAIAMCEKKKKPHMFVVDQLDRENADFDKAVASINEKYSQAVPIQLPIMQGNKMVGYVNIVTMTARMYKGKEEIDTDIPANLVDRSQEIYNQLTETAAGADEELMEKYFEEDKLCREDIIKGLSIGVIDGTVIPVCCVSALNDEGVSTLLDKCTYFLPTADQVPAKKAVDVKTGSEVEVGIEGPFAAQVIKTVNDQFGKYSICKVYRGSIDSSVAPYNSSSENVEKPSTPYYMKGKKTYPIDHVFAGDIAVLAKLQNTATNDTLCDQSAPVKFAEIEFPAPCINLAVAAKKQGEEDKVISSLKKICEEDPSIRIDRNEETGDVLVCGLGEMHIDVACAKVKNRNNVEAALSDPKIPYRETIRSMAEAEGKHKKQSGGSGQFGVVQMRFEPAPEGTDYEFVNAIVGGVVPKEYIPAVEKGLKEAMVHGVLAGYPMVGIKATLYDGKYHPVDSKEVAFKSAARLSYKAACAKASPALIEPIYRYTIFVPNDYVGDVIGDLNRRRGRMLGMNPTGEGTEVVAEAPLSEMFKYATDLRSMTQARGSFTSEYVRYEDVPGNVAQKIIEQAKIEDEDED